ncbi:MAG TPA: extracellular solute-binding protein [Micromonosporaceae bacterium]|nr:extracellular solute-binding protein [Micromonosporaceae bacterium]
MRLSRPARRSAAAPAAALLAAVLALTAACGAPEPEGGSGNASAPPSVVPDKPSAPVTLNVFDVAGNLQLTQPMIDAFVAANPDTISKVTYSKGTAPELAGKVKAQQDAGQLQIDLVLTGTDGLAAGISQNLWTKLFPDYEANFPKFRDNYLEPAAKMQDLAQDQGVVVTYYPSGPLIEYNPKTVPNPPKTAQELLDWAKAHPGKFQYAVPKNSGPGRTFLMGLPYILKDSDPKDPDKGWDKTWAYLKEMAKYSANYPSGTTETMKNLANGTTDIIVSTTGWDINPRALGTVPKDMKVGTLEGFTWVTDAHYAVIPKGQSADKIAATFALVKFMLTPQQQAVAYDSGYFYPGPAVKGVTLDMAPQKSQQIIKDFGRPEYDKLIEDNPKATSLPADKQVAAFDKWDREVATVKK